MQDDHFLAGVSSGYSSAQPSTLLRTISKEFIANPILIFDELDKVSKTNNSDIQARLLGLLEEHESARWYEAYLQSEVDFSHLSFLFTANTLESIPSALKSRVRIVEMPSLTDVHIKTYVNNIVSEVSTSSEIDPRFYQLTESDYNLLSYHWKDHRNLRLLKKQVTFLLEQSVSVEHSAFLQ
jgi:ATP-dependent Lon protease